MDGWMDGWMDGYLFTCVMMMCLTRVMIFAVICGSAPYILSK